MTVKSLFSESLPANAAFHGLVAVRPTLTAVVVMLGLGLSGCDRAGEKLYPVSGKVTFEGKAVSAGAVRLKNPQAGIDMRADLRADGAYDVIVARGSGLPEGTYQVAICPPVTPEDLRMGTGMGMGMAKSQTKPRVYPDIPAKYRDPSTSGLTLTVVPGSNVFDVDMRNSDVH